MLSYRFAQSRFKLRRTKGKMLQPLACVLNRAQKPGCERTGLRRPVTLKSLWMSLPTAAGRRRSLGHGWPERPGRDHRGVVARVGGVVRDERSRRPSEDGVMMSPRGAGNKTSKRMAGSPVAEVRNERRRRVIGASAESDLVRALATEQRRSGCVRHFRSECGSVRCWWAV